LELRSICPILGSHNPGSLHFNRSPTECQVHLDANCRRISQSFMDVFLSAFLSPTLRSSTELFSRFLWNERSLHASSNSQSIWRWMGVLLSAFCSPEHSRLCVHILCLLEDATHNPTVCHDLANQSGKPGWDSSQTVYFGGSDWFPLLGTNYFDKNCGNDRWNHNSLLAGKLVIQTLETFLGDFCQGLRFRRICTRGLLFLRYP